MKILIIGSEGFIGRNAVRFFRDKGYSVYEADIVLKVADHYTAINPEFADFARLFHKTQYDVCINATGAANVQFSFQHAALDFTLNASNIYHILEAIKQHNPSCKFVNFSSAAVYGNPQYLPIDENHPVRPLSPYGWHKYYSELICKEFFDFFNIQTLSLRVFSAYGPGLKKQIFWDLFQKAQKDKKVSIYGTGNETRDFIFVDDLLNAVHCVIMNATFNGLAVNIANGEELRIADIANTYFKLIDSNLEATFSGETKIGDPLNWKADVKLLKQLGYSQEFTLEEGLKQYLRWIGRD